MTEVANIYPTDIKRHLIHARDRQTVATIRQAADASCRGQIPPAYIRHVFNTFKEGLVYQQDGHVSAFCIWKIRTTTNIQMVTNGELFILLVCSIPQPFSALDMILFDVERHCRERGIRAISLEPANDALRDYYQKKGFTESNPPGRLVKPVDTPIVFNASRRSTTMRRARSSLLLNGGIDTE
jgi:hypothetical protein